MHSHESPHSNEPSSLALPEQVALQASGPQVTTAPPQVPAAVHAKSQGPVPHSSTRFEHAPTFSHSTMQLALLHSTLESSHEDMP